MSNKMIDTTIDANDLWEEKQYTDMKAGGIKAFYPIKPDGTEDTSREPIFVAVTNIETGVGLFPVHGRIEDCTTLEKALVDFQVTLDNVVSEMMEQAEKRELEEQAKKGRIITLDQVNPRD